MAQHTMVRFVTQMFLALTLITTSFMVNRNGNVSVEAFQPATKIHISRLMANPKLSTTVSKMSSDNDADMDHQRPAFPVMMASAWLLSTMAFVAVPAPAWSQPPDITQGQVLFQANCAGCHAGGNNYIQEKRTLRKDAIQQYRGSTDQAVIANFVQNGMPHKLLPMKTPMEEKDYNDVVAYVLDQAVGEKW